MNENNLEHLLDNAQKKFRVGFEPVKINNTVLNILQIQNLDEYLETLADKSSGTDPLELPFWAKIWPASILLAYSLDRLTEPGDPHKQTVLELGAGTGLCGLYTAALGFATTITDNNKDALLFARINALKNDLASRVKVDYADMGKTVLDTGFDYILGSEILYIQDLNRALVKFISRHLNPGGRVILSADYKRQSKKFFNLAAEEFDISHKTIGYKEKNSQGKQERFLCSIYTLTRKRDD
ncbi:MAG: class I SAM-dependent methyltransferase [Desulfonatronovibrionaceae bacterium]